MTERERCDVSGAPAVKWQAEHTISKWENGVRKTGANVMLPLAGLGDDGGSEVSREFFVKKMDFLVKVLCESAGKEERAEFLRQEFSGSYRKSHAERIVQQVFFQVNPLPRFSLTDEPRAMVHSSSSTLKLASLLFSPCLVPRTHHHNSYASPSSHIAATPHLGRSADPS